MLVADIETRRETRQSLRAQAEEIQSLEAKRDEIRNRGSAYKIQIENNSERLNTLQQALEDIAQQQQILQNVQDASCPLCGSELDQTHREEVATKLSNQLREQQDRRSHNWNRIFKKPKQNANSTDIGIKKLKTNSHRAEDTAQHLAEAEAALKEAENAVQTRETLSAKINALKTQLREQTQNSPDARALSQARSALEKPHL